MKCLGYYNGKYGNLEDMYVPMNDRASYFGDGVYDATYSRNGIIYTLDEHIDRFYNSARLLKIEIPYTKDELKEILNNMVKKVEQGDNFVYWQATRGTGIRNHVFPKEGKANIWITIKPSPIQDMSRRIKLITQEDTRFLHCNIKTLNLIPNVMASQKALENGCDECVFHRGERVTECAHSNVHIIKDGVFKTAPTDQYILPGIARAHLIRACKKNNIPVDETPFTVSELIDADEVIVSSSGSFCLVADEVDHKRVGGKAPEIIRTLQTHLMHEFIEETTIK